LGEVSDSLQEENRGMGAGVDESLSVGLPDFDDERRLCAQTIKQRTKRISNFQ
jgi:hypothetical protein